MPRPQIIQSTPEICSYDHTMTILPSVAVLAQVIEHSIHFYIPNPRYRHVDLSRRWCKHDDAEEAIPARLRDTT